MIFKFGNTKFDRQPSSENLVIFIWEQVQPRLRDIKLHRIRLRETPTIFTEYYGPKGIVNENK